MSDSFHTSTRDLAIEIARLACDRHAEDILVLDLRKLSPVTDYFVIATGTSDRQIRAWTDETQQRGKDLGHPPCRIAGYDTAEWVVMDFVDVIVHWFTEPLRRYYDLELIWGESPQVDWRRPEG